MTTVQQRRAQKGKKSLPSWNDGSAKTAVLDFVTRVTTEGGPAFVPAAKRIATFDNDGTLWAEHPLIFQLYFALDRLDQLAAQTPETREQQPFKAFLERDLKTIATFTKREALEFAFATHTGVTTEEFAEVVEKWLITTKHPQLGLLVIIVSV